MKIHVVGAELFLADGRTDRQTEYRQAYSHDEINSRLSQFCERS
jgi:hypothetical protein